jgi:hypothetical protein
MVEGVSVIAHKYFRQVVFSKGIPAIENSKGTGSKTESVLNEVYEILSTDLYQ